jgi:hypothetical protein
VQAEPMLMLLFSIAVAVAIAARFSHHDLRAKLKREYEHRIAEERRRIGSLNLNRSAIAAQEMRWARRHLLLTEKNYAIDSFRQSVVSQEIYEKLLADIDARLLRLESGHAEEAIDDGHDPRKRTAEAVISVTRPNARRRISYRSDKQRQRHDSRRHISGRYEYSYLLERPRTIIHYWSADRCRRGRLVADC